MAPKTTPSTTPVGPREKAPSGPAPAPESLWSTEHPHTLPACCVSHDGPHLHGCTRPRMMHGSTHPGICLLDGLAS
jgi:hypothetical protein